MTWKDYDGKARPAYYEIQLPPGIGNVTDPFDIIEALGMNFNLGCVVKYVCRAGRKTPDPLEDLKKARNCLDREITRLSRKTASDRGT